MDQILKELEYLKNLPATQYAPNPIPDPTDDSVRRVLGFLHRADPATREDLLSRMGRKHQGMFAIFAFRMASYAVRTGKALHIRQGLFAAAISSRLDVDFRDLVDVLSPLYRSLEKLRLNPAKYFAEIDGVGEESFDAFARNFPKRPPEERSLAEWGYCEGQDQDGFRYRGIKNL